MLLESRLDVAQLDAETPQLDLVIEAAEKFESAVGATAGQVAGAVEPGAVSPAERIGDEALGGQGGALAIAPGQAVAADRQLAGNP